MRKIFMLLLLFLVITSVMNTQEIIENPKKPLSKNSGRTLKLVEKLRITDKPGVFYFRSPGNVKITEDGHIYIADPYGNNFIKFSPNGEFLKNLYKKGEGPGEIQDYFDYALSQNEIYIYDFVKRKVIHMEQDGSLINEFKTYTEQYTDLNGIFRDWLVFMKDVWPPGIDRKTSRFYEIKMKIIKLFKDGGAENESYIFSYKRFLIASSLGGGMRVWDPFDSVLDENSGYLYVSCTREYMIHILDLNKGEVIRSFKRKYKRIRHEMSKSEEASTKKYNAPRKKYEVDIERLHLYKGLLWVETSTKDEERGIMIDVFNSKGQFLDNFYLALDGNLKSIQDNFIFVLKSDEEGNYIIKKCVIEDEN